MKGRRTKSRCIFRITYLPAPFTRIHRFYLTVFLHGSHTNTFPFRWSSNSFISPCYRTVYESSERHLHIRLPWAEPDFAYQHIVQFHLLSIGNGNRIGLITGRRSLDSGHPFSFRIGGYFIHFPVPRWTDNHFGIRICLSPQTSLSLLLQYHIVTHNVGQCNLAPCSSLHHQQTGTHNPFFHLTLFFKSPFLQKWYEEECSQNRKLKLHVSHNIIFLFTKIVHLSSLQLILSYPSFSKSSSKPLYIIYHISLHILRSPTQNPTFPEPKTYVSTLRNIRYLYGKRKTHNENIPLFPKHFHKTISPFPYTAKINSII